MLESNGSFGTSINYHPIFQALITRSFGVIEFVGKLTPPIPYLLGE